jgi:NhaP-type Na+/H+ or K+/H+ antiporter
MVMGTCIERYHCKFGHEAAYTILIGLAVSAIIASTRGESETEMLRFSDNTFFYVCLPPIVFSSGFNMQRGNFFQNFKMIMLFGVLTTFLCFFMFSGFTILLKDGMQQYHGDSGEWRPLELDNAEILLMCSLLCSSDVIAAISLISYDDQPKLFSIVFGEGITNDAVSIILFNTVMKYVGDPKNVVEVTWKTPFAIIGEFMGLAFNSLIIGLVFALLSSYILKSFREFSKNPIAECMMIFCFGYLAYLLSEQAEASGIISLLTCGIVMAHYTWYNLSPQGKQSSFIVFQFLGYILEAFIFSYLGLTFFSYKTLAWSYDLFLVELGVIIVARMIGTIGFVGVLSKCGFKSPLNFKELIFVWYAGMIRGAIAFGLVLRIDKSFVNRDVIVTTSLSLVVFTTVVFGSTVGVIGKCLFRDVKEEEQKKEKAEAVSKTKALQENLLCKVNEDKEGEDNDDGY